MSILEEICDLIGYEYLYFSLSDEYFCQNNMSD